MGKVEEFLESKGIPGSYYNYTRIKGKDNKNYELPDLIEEFAEKQRSDDVDFIVDDWHSMEIYTDKTKKRKLKVRLKHLTRK